MSIISGDAYKTVSEFQVSKKQTEPKIWNKINIPVIKKQGVITMLTKYKDGFMLYRAELNIDDAEISTDEFILKHQRSIIDITFRDKDGFSTGLIMSLAVSNAINNISASKGSVSLSWESKIPVKLEAFDSIEHNSVSWNGL